MHSHPEIEIKDREENVDLNSVEEKRRKKEEEDLKSHLIALSRATWFVYNAPCICYLRTLISS